MCSPALTRALIASSVDLPLCRKIGQQHFVAIAIDHNCLATDRASRASEKGSPAPGLFSVRTDNELITGRLHAPCPLADHLDRAGRHVLTRRLEAFGLQAFNADLDLAPADCASWVKSLLSAPRCMKPLGSNAIAGIPNAQAAVTPAKSIPVCPPERIDSSGQCFVHNESTSKRTCLLELVSSRER